MIGQSQSYTLSDSEILKINDFLESHGHEPLESKSATIYLRAKIKERIFTCTTYKREKRQNNHTISFCDCTLGFALIDKFLCINKVHLAVITKLTSQKGLAYQIPYEVITEESQNVLFEDYFTYTTSSHGYIFTYQIVDKCINLSANASYLLTSPVNSVEIE